MINQYLFGGVHYMVVAADHGVHLHGHIVNHHRVIIGGNTVTAAQNKIIQLIILKYDVAFDHIFNNRCPA